MPDINPEAARVRQLVAAPEVLIVGAGPTGLLTAIELRRRGIDAHIAERAGRVAPHAKALVLWPRALEALDRAGIADAVRGASRPITAANYYTAGKAVGRINFRPLAGTRWGQPLAVPQQATERILRERLDELNGIVHYGAAVTSVTRTSDGILTRCDDREFTSQWIVGCDGAHSAVRKSCDIEFAGAAYPQKYALVDGKWRTSLDPNESYYFMSPAGVLVFVGLPDGLARAFVSLPADIDPTTLDPDDLAATVTSLARQRCPVPLEVTDVQGSGAFTVQQRLAETFRRDRVLLVGDAAHVHSPAGGQGLNTGLLDAHELGWRLAGVVSGSVDEHELDRWAAERRGVAHHVIRDTDWQTRLWSATGWRRRLRDVGLRAMQRSGALDRTLPRRFSQLDLSYDGPGGHRPVGRRMPDLTLNTGEYLSDLLRHGKHVLVHGTDEVSRSAEPAAVTRTVDPVGDVEIAYAAAGHSPRWLGRQVALVRPDGVVAAIAPDPLPV